VRTTEFIHGKVAAISTSTDRQEVTLSNGERISARLIVLANGLNIGLRESLGLRREVISPCHSITIGFDMEPVGRAAFAFPALTYYPERTSDQMAFLTIFPIGSTMRANLCLYRDMRDPWLKRMRDAPKETLLAALPGLRKFTGDFKVTGFVKIRPADLCVTKGHLQPGVVLVGDAFATSCPAAGTGTGKVFTDVERLCNVYVPTWLATAGMAEDKIAAFYTDPVKKASDAHSHNKAFGLRSLSTDPGLPWKARRWARFAVRLSIGSLRSMRERVVPRGHGVPSTQVSLH
jgi:2-polyprenyl-6-methoxyphenol hydroxylase-like FAD-dependent oxidoreductase